MLSIQKHNFNGLYRGLYGGLCGMALGLGLLFGQPQGAYAGIEADRSSAVIFVYQRIGEDSQPQSNISVEQFKEHIRELQTGGYTVLPLPKIIAALKDGQTLPQKTVALTFEGAFLGTLKKAVPLLDEAGLPYTVFYASDMIDNKNPAHMNWSQLKDLRGDRLATLGILPAAYTHMAGLTADESAALINRAVTRYRDEFGEQPAFFAYPYGEYSNALKKQVASYAFKAAFGQQSGVAYAGADFLALPRFTMTDAYGDLDRFQLTANALPLPVADVTPGDMLLKSNPPIIGFTVTPDIKDISSLSCFISGMGKAELQKPGGNRVEIRLKDPLEDRRTRVNCTLPDDTLIPGQPRSWRWFGMMMISPQYDDDTAPAAGNADADSTDDSPGDD
jgi:peptidoglycan/xylan/chitin deacetylase (PgdA/CDA1 family)